MILQGDCLDKLKDLEDNSVDLLVTDPPYALQFMNKSWDKALPSIEVWKECLRVMKPGAFGFVMCAPRQDCLSQMTVRLGEAGFNTNFTSIYWTYASGFPKAHNISKSIDKKFGITNVEYKEPFGREGRNKKPNGAAFNTIYDGNDGKIPYSIPTTDQAKQFDGSYGGFQPKPAVEVIIVVMKPMTEPTFVGQALDNGKGITWLDDCRIPYASDDDKDKSTFGTHNDYSSGGSPFERNKSGESWSSKHDGRFPANLIVSDDVLDDKPKKKSDIPTAGHRTKTFAKDGEPISGGEGSPDYEANIKGRFPANLLVSDDVLDYENPIPPAGNKIAGKRTWLKDSESPPVFLTINDGTCYSRFFSLDAWAEKNLPFLIVPKASKREKNNGCDEVKCSHPTVKPIKLMSYLITMGSRKGEVVLDPFAGSMSTGCACVLGGRKYIMIDQESEYVEIGKARLKYYEDRKVEELF